MHIKGTSGADSLTGTANADKIFGRGGDDTINAGDGNDVIDAGSGSNHVDAGAGNDKIVITEASTFAALNGGAGIDTLYWANTDIAVSGSFGGDSIEKFYAGGGNDNIDIQGAVSATIVDGGAGDDTITASSGNQTLLGGDGNDTLRIGYLDIVNGSGNMHLDGGGGANNLYFEADYYQQMPIIDLTSGTISNTPLTGTISNIDNVVFQTFAPGQYFELIGNDDANAVSIVNNYSYGAIFDGMGGNDTLSGSFTADTIDGGSGDDSITSYEGNDSLSGSSGNDVISAGDGSDTVNGGAGKDTIFGGAGDDVLVGGSGRDVVSFNDLQTSGVVVDLAKGTAISGEDGTDTLSKIEDVIGSSQNDKITGDAHANLLEGGAGKDVLNGGGGNDTLIGGTGADQLTGSTGNVHFVYQSVFDSSSAAPDTITDLSNNDTIDLRGIDADETHKRDQAFHLVDGFTGHAGELTVAYDGTTTTISGDVNGDDVADLVIYATGDHHDFTNFAL